MSGKKFDWNRFNNLNQDLNEINTWLKSLSKKYENVKIIKGGEFFEGRTIEGVLLSKNPDNPGIFIEGGIHAREWISPATATLISNQLLTSNDKKVQDLAENYNW